MDEFPIGYSSAGVDERFGEFEALERLRLAIERPGLRLVLPPEKSEKR